MSGFVKQRPRWGPLLEEAEVAAVWVRERGPGVLTGVRRLQKVAGVPMQAVRGDRVLSRVHLVMAAEHQRRSLDHARAADDPGVEFLRFLAARKQIGRALDDLGVPQQEPGPPLLVVALAAAKGLETSASEAGLVPLGRWTDHEAGRGEGGDLWRESRAEARLFWNGRLGLGRDASDQDRESGVLAAMARLALEG